MYGRRHAPILTLLHIWQGPWNCRARAQAPICMFPPQNCGCKHPSHTKAFFGSWVLHQKCLLDKIVPYGFWGLCWFKVHCKKRLPAIITAATLYWRSTICYMLHFTCRISYSRHILVPRVLLLSLYFRRGNNVLGNLSKLPKRIKWHSLNLKLLSSVSKINVFFFFFQSTC